MEDINLVTGYDLLTAVRNNFEKIIRLLDKYKYANKALYVSQECIIDLLIKISRTIKTLREECKELRGTASDRAKGRILSGGKLSTEFKQKNSSLYAQARERENLVGELQYARWLLRYLGDGIAWHALAFDRALIRAMGSKEPVGVPGEKDLIKYRDLARKVRRETQRKVLPLIHDLSNCMRTDDLSVLANAKVYSVELKLTEDGGKAKGTDQRSKKQRSRRIKIQKYLETGEMGELYPSLQGGKLYKSEVLQFHNFDAIGEALLEVRTSGFGIVRTEKAILYIASDPSADGIETAFVEAKKLHPDIFKTLFTFRSISPRKDEYHDALPITAMELKADDILDIIFKKFGVIVILNFDLLQEQFLAEGLQLSITKNGDAIEIIVENEPKVSIQQGSWDKILLEGFSMNSLIQQIKEIQRLNPEEKGLNRKNRLELFE